MKLKKGEGFYLLFSLVLIVLIVGVGFLAKQSRQDKTGEVEVAPSHLVTSSSSSSEQDWSKVEEDLKNLEANPNQDDLQKVQTEIDKVTDSTKEAEYQERLNSVGAQLAISEAQANPTVNNLQVAQEAVNKVQNATEKANLQAQLNTISQTPATQGQSYGYAN